MKLEFSHNPRHSGFSLVVTITVLILLSLIAVGLLSLSTTTLRASQHSASLAVARANACLGMNLALGELQKNLGPDRRVTARSEILSSAPAAPLITGVFDLSESGQGSDPVSYFQTLRENAKENVVWLVSSAKPLTDPTTESISLLNGAEKAALQTAFDRAGNLYSVEAGKIPLRGTGGRPLGSFAWWVDDESQKAKLNVVAPETLSNGQKFEEAWKLTSAQQANFFQDDVEPSLEGYSPRKLGSYDPTDRDVIHKLATINQADLAYQVDGVDDWFRKNQIDFTVWSESVPVDVLQGRLKQDLSYFLETGQGLDSGTPVIRGSDEDSDYVGPDLGGLDYQARDMPRFGLIKSWRDIGKTVTGYDTGGSESQPQTSEEHGIHPVILRAGIYYAPYIDDRVGTENVSVAGGGSSPAHYVTWKLAAFPRITIWNPTSVPITDSSLLYQVGITNHFMLVLSGDQNNVLSGGAARDNRNVEYWRAFNDARRMSFYNMMNAARGNDVIPAGGSGEATMPLHTYSLRLDSPLLPGQTRTFYPANPQPALLEIVSESGFKNLKGASINVMSATPAPNNYFRVADGNGNEFERKIYAKGRNNRPLAARPPTPEFLETYLYVRMAESGPRFKGQHTHGCAYRLFKPQQSGPPSLLQEIFSAEHTNVTNGFPAHSISNAREYDDPDDGIAADGFSLVKIYQDPNQELSARRGHQMYISYALEDPESDFNSRFKDKSRQFPVFSHYNPRAPHVFPGSYEESKTGVGDSAVGFEPEVQGVRQSLYSEGRPEASWLNDWSVESFQASENGYGGSGDFGSTGLFDLNINSNGLTYLSYDFPRKADGLLSMGDLQAVNFATYPWQPGNAFGNSLADPRIPRDQLVNDIDPGEDHPYVQSLDLGRNRYIDLSWLLNYSLWDRFFASTIEYSESSTDTSSGAVLRNARHKLVARKNQPGGGNLVDNDEASLENAAANIRVDGGFNVNTTSVPAWKQFLSSNFDLQVRVKNDGSGTDSTPSSQAVFPRFLYPYRAEMPEGGRGLGQDDAAIRGAFSANRSLTDEEVQKLAENLVEEVRQRGPFLSLSDFINRRLVKESDARFGEWAGLSGTLQTAIDRVTVKEEMLNAHLEDVADLNFQKSDVPEYLEQSHVVGRPGDIEQSRLAGSPGSLTQADILRTIGPLLTARGDTFRIRSYGESRSSSGAIQAQAWCEAIVQREADTVSPDDDVVAPDEEEHPFGRRFKMVSFKWLNEDEL